MNITYTFKKGTKAKAQEVNDNFKICEDSVNGLEQKHTALVSTVNNGFTGHTNEINNIKTDITTLETTVNTNKSEIIQEVESLKNQSDSNKAGLNNAISKYDKLIEDTKTALEAKDSELLTQIEAVDSKTFTLNGKIEDTQEALETLIEDTKTALEAKDSELLTQIEASNSEITTLNSKVDANTTARHTHSNKAVLDATTASFTTAINSTINQKANDADVVKLAGTQTISGVKTFSAVINGNLSGNVTGNLTGTAQKATSDANGNNIANTYATKAQISTLAKKEVFANPALTSAEGVAVWNVTHTLNTQDLCAALRRLSDNAEIFAEIIFTTASQVTVKMNTGADILANTYKIVLIG